MAFRHEFTFSTESEIYRWYKSKQVKCKLVEQHWFVAAEEQEVDYDETKMILITFLKHFFILNRQTNPHT